MMSEESRHKRERNPVAPQANGMPKFLTEEQLAERWVISPKALQKWRLTGEGPIFVKIGSRVRYSIDEIEKFEACAVRRSTSDGSPAC